MLDNCTVLYISSAAIHHDGPYIHILDQPQSKFRFRYKSEMVGTHGQLKASRADKNNRAAFPTVKVTTILKII